MIVLAPLFDLLYHPYFTDIYQLLLLLISLFAASTENLNH